jgi:uncharacterized membrane protein YagU involved in acid resistance
MAQIATLVSVRPVFRHWRAAIVAGLIAGAVFLMFEMIMMPLFMGVSPWAPPRMMAAIVLGQGVLPPPDTFDFGLVMVAMMVHVVLSIVYAFIIGFFVQERNVATAATIGAIAGLAIYLINFYGFTAIFPWFAMARGWVSVVGHILFGLVVAWSYRGLQKD